MKKNLFITFAIIFVIYGCCGINNNCVIDDDFFNDLSSEDHRINASLYLDYFNENLQTLTYDYYIDFLKKDVKSSAKGLTEKILCADNYYFVSATETFTIVLLYKGDKRIIGDIAGTPNLDTNFIFEGDLNNINLKDIADAITK